MTKLQIIATTNFEILSWVGVVHMMWLDLEYLRAMYPLSFLIIIYHIIEELLISPPGLESVTPWAVQLKKWTWLSFVHRTSFPHKRSMILYVFFYSLSTLFHIFLPNLFPFMIGQPFAFVVLQIFTFANIQLFPFVRHKLFPFFLCQLFCIFLCSITWSEFIISLVLLLDFITCITTSLSCEELGYVCTIMHPTMLQIMEEGVTA